MKAIENLVEFEKVSKVFGTVRAVEDLSFRVFAGEVVAFLGPNGAGKSTSLKLLQGLRRPTRGRVKVFGMDPWEVPARAKLGVTPQDLDFPANLKVREVLRMVCWAFGADREKSLLSRLRLEDLAHRKTGGLSGGEKRRLGLACALAGSPRLLLLDEPTTGLDVESRRLLWAVLTEERKRGASILLTTHDLDEVEKVADRVIVIDRGQKLFEGSVVEIKRRVNFQKIEFYLSADHSLSGLESVSIHRQGERCQVISRNADHFVREMVRLQIPFRHLQVTAASLEEAFLQLRQVREAPAPGARLENLETVTGETP